MQDVEVSLVLLFNKLSKFAFSLGSEIISHIDLQPCLLKHFSALQKSYFDDGVSVLKGREGVLLVDGLQFSFVIEFNVLENICEQLANQVQYLHVMLLQGHL